MKESAVEHLVHEFESAVAEQHQPFDGSGDWRIRVNEAATRMIVISREIAGRGPGAVAEFAKLVESKDRHLALWAAHHMLDFMEPDAACRAAAMTVVERTASGDGPESAVEKFWLESWKAEQQDE
jgi:hypothetical protein